MHCHDIVLVIFLKHICSMQVMYQTYQNACFGSSYWRPVSLRLILSNILALIKYWPWISSEWNAGLTTFLGGSITARLAKSCQAVCALLHSWHTWQNKNSIILVLFKNTQRMKDFLIIEWVHSIFNYLVNHVWHLHCKTHDTNQHPHSHKSIHHFI